MATTLRGFVMLAVLVGLPAAWLYFGPLPKNAQRVVDRVVAAAKEAVGWDKRHDQRATPQPVIAPAPRFSGQPGPAMDPFKMAVEAGRAAFESGPGSSSDVASPTSPLTAFLDSPGSEIVATRVSNAYKGYWAL